MESLRRYLKDLSEWTIDLMNPHINYKYIPYFRISVAPQFYHQVGQNYNSYIIAFCTCSANPSCNSLGGNGFPACPTCC